MRFLLGDEAVTAQVPGVAEPVDTSQVAVASVFVPSTTVVTTESDAVVQSRSIDAASSSVTGAKPLPVSFSRMTVKV